MPEEPLANEKYLEELKVEDEIESRKASIAEKKAFAKEMKRKYGTDWKKVLGIAGRFISKARINQDTLMTLHATGQNFRDLTVPHTRRPR